MELLVASALVIGVIGAIITYLYVGPLRSLGLMVPATFLGAASYFAAGGDRAALAKSVPTNVWSISSILAEKLVAPEVEASPVA